MKKYFLLIGAFMILTGCSKPQITMETVNDDLSVPAAAIEPYEIQLYIPRDAVECERSAASSRTEYRHENGDYRIETRIFCTDTAQSAIRQIAETPASELTVLQTTRFSLPEYRFAWYKDGENRRADLVMDGDLCYAVIFAAAEAAGNSCSRIMTQVFSSFGISDSAEVSSLGG